MAETETLIRRKEAARRLDVAERTIRRWGASGRLDERQIGPRAVRVTEASVERLVRSGARNLQEGGEAA
jgi:excisionase family DNA binding protein